jgi:hypothetical protein
LSGKKVNPHGTSIPVATVPATTSFTARGAVVVPGVEVADLVDTDGSASPPLSPQPATKAPTATITAAVRVPPLALSTFISLTSRLPPK